MGTVAVCDGTIAVAYGGLAPFSCSGSWVFLTEQELLSQASQNQLLSREDFNILSASILAIMIVAMGLRLVLKTLNIGVNSNEKN